MESSTFDDSDEDSDRNGQAPWKKLEARRKRREDSKKEEARMKERGDFHKRLEARRKEREDSKKEEARMKVRGDYKKRLEARRKEREARMKEREDSKKEEARMKERGDFKKRLEARRKEREEPRNSSPVCKEEEEERIMEARKEEEEERIMEARKEEEEEGRWGRGRRSIYVEGRWGLVTNEEEEEGRWGRGLRCDFPNPRKSYSRRVSRFIKPRNSSPGRKYLFTKPRNSSPGRVSRFKEERRRRKEAPLEIHARGPVAVKAYNDALKDGEASVNRIPVILVGQERTGKTSLKRSLKGELFDKFEESTDGIQADTGYFKVSKEIWKTGKKIEDAGPESSISFENLAAAKLILEQLRRENLSSQDVPQQSKNATHLDTEKTSRDTASSTSSQPNGNDDSPFDMPEIPEEVLHELTKLLQRERDVSDINDIYSILWDFAGQSVYYDTHPIFLIENAIYLLVANLSHNPEEKATPPVKKGLYRNIVDSHNNKTNLDFLDFWMSSIFSLASPESSCSDSATNGQENLPGRLPPVFLVCTHADKPFNRTNARDQALEIYRFLRSKAYRQHLFKDVFAVDNTKSGGDHECLEVVRLREKVLAVAKEFPLMKTKIPLRWLKYENLLHIRMEHDKWIPLNEARRIAFDECIIHNEAEFSTLLNFLHDQRIVVHFSGSPELERMVILDPQWLVDVLKKIITVKRYEHSEKQVESMWLKLEDTGVLDERLIDHAWRDLFDNQESRDSLIAILERLSLLCSWPSADSNKQYLVPSMLMSPPTKDVLRLLASAKMPSLFITFASGRVPPGLFSRLILLFLQWCKEEWKSEVSPQLFHNFAMFYILPGQGVSLIFRCHSSSIEIVVYSGDIDNETGAKSSYENYDQTLGRAIHWKLRLVLECMHKEFHWLKNVNYDMCVCCPVCSQAGSIKCRAHDVYGCECLHFLSESDLRQLQYCDRPGRILYGDRRIRVNQFKCWFSFEDVEKSAGISTNRQPQAFNASGPESSLDEGGIFPLEGTTRKELALPENVKSSIQSISFRSTSDVEDIVIQFQEALQLEPASLESPEPETKSMIRGLALRAKSEKRDDLGRC